MMTDRVRRGWQGLPPPPREVKEKQSPVSKEVIDSEEDDVLDEDE